MPSTSLTYRYAVADIKNSLKILTKDAEISTQNVVFWIRVAENMIRQRTLKVEMTGAYLSEYYGVNAIPVNTDGTKKWIELPNGIYDLDNEKGIEYISYNQPGIPFVKQTRFQQTNAQIIDQLVFNPYEFPKPSNPYFYRVGNNIFLLGIENVAVVNVNLGIYGALDPRPVLLSPDSFLQINDEQYVSLREIVLGFGRFVMVVPASRDEIGSDERNESMKTFSKATQQPQPEQ